MKLSLVVVHLIGILALTTSNQFFENLGKCARQEKASELELRGYFTIGKPPLKYKGKCALRCYMDTWNFSGTEHLDRLLNKHDIIKTCSSIKDADRCEEGYKKWSCYRLSKKVYNYTNIVPYN